MTADQDRTPFMPWDPFLDVTSQKQKLPPPRLSLSSIWQGNGQGSSDMASSIWSFSSTSEEEDDLEDYDPVVPSVMTDDPLRAIWAKQPRRLSLSSHTSWPTYATHGRRHSVAGPLMMESPSEDDTQFSRHQQHILNKGVLDHIDEYFGGHHGHPPWPSVSSSTFGNRSLALYSPPTPGRTMTASGDAATFGCTTVLMGKGIPMHHFLDSNTLLYTVEFKSNRRDICYIMQGDAFAPPLESLVLVEADRGRDLGKVVQVATANDLLENQQHDPSTLKSHVKRLFRMAEPGEIQSLKAKEKEEDQAVAFCQAKIKEKDLPMEVVSAEFQWDRRKLTFYFKADQRIDFRELVRELFKTYKTRIWMCALTAAQDELSG